MSQNSPSIAGDLTFGAIAGTIATFALSGISNVLYAGESRGTRFREEWARRGQSANKVAVKKLANAAGVSLTKEQVVAGEGALHFGIGAGAGATYGAIRRHIPAPAITKGLGFGATLWLMADEGLNPALGLTPGPAAFPWQAHARGLVSHLVFGLATEGVLLVADHFRARPTGR